MQLINGSTELERGLNFIHKGVRFLQNFLKHPQANVEKVTLVLTDIEVAAREAESLYNSFLANQMTESRVWDAFKFLVSVKLLKPETLLIKLMDYNPCAKDQIESLNEGLKFLRKFLSRQPEENPSDGKQILNRMEEVAKEAMSFYHSFHPKQITEETIKERMTLFLSSLLEKLNHVKAEIKDIYLHVISLPLLNFPKSQGLGFVDFFLENQKELIKYNADLTDPIQHQISSVLKDLESLRSSLEMIGKQYNKDPELKDLCTRVADVAYQADYVIDSIRLKNNTVWYNVSWLYDVMDEIKDIKVLLIEITRTKKDCTGVQNAARTSGPMIPQTSYPENDQFEVALEDEEKLIIDRLTHRSSKRREVVSIVGMPGIGKTTLARKVCDNPSGKNHFHIQAWCCVSQVYQRRELLLKILGDINKLTDEIHNKRDQDLLEMIYKGLNGNRYLIVMDDVWSMQAWKDLDSAFPDDSNGSRILLTSRYDKVAKEAQHDIDPHFLRFLTKDETCKLLQMKVFHEEGWPKELLEVGPVIANSCKGLPLAVVAIAGLLRRTEKKVDWWKQIAEDLNSHILDPESQCLHILELSYNHLPDELKPCFLYFAAWERTKRCQFRS